MSTPASILLRHDRDLWPAANEPAPAPRGDRAVSLEDAEGFAGLSFDAVLVDIDPPERARITADQQTSLHRDRRDFVNDHAAGRSSSDWGDCVCAKPFDLDICSPR